MDVGREPGKAVPDRRVIPLGSHLWLFGPIGVDLGSAFIAEGMQERVPKGHLSWSTARLELPRIQEFLSGNDGQSMLAGFLQGEASKPISEPYQVERFRWFRSPEQVNCQLCITEKGLFRCEDSCGKKVYTPVIDEDLKVNGLTLQGLVRKLTQPPEQVK